MNKYSVIAIIVAVLFGAVIGGMFTSHKAEKELLKQKHDHEKALEHQADSLIDLIHRRDKKLVDLNDHIKLDSIKIQGMLYKIQQDGVRTEQKRVEAKKFTDDEKVAFILKRYSH
jgi:predicted acylesterase/phospholipase RssA